MKELIQPQNIDKTNNRMDRPRSRIICEGYFLKNNMVDNANMTSIHNEPFLLASRPISFDPGGHPRAMYTSQDIPYPPLITN